MNKMQLAYIELLRVYEGMLEQAYYSQFTVDLIQNELLDVEDEQLLNGSIIDVVKAFHYHLDTILDIVKPCIDKDLIQLIASDIEDLLK